MLRHSIIFFGLSSLCALGGCKNEDAEPARARADPSDQVGEEEADSRGNIRPYEPDGVRKKKAIDYDGVDVGAEPLTGAQDSLEALGQAVVAGLGSRDQVALEAIALDRAQYDRLFDVLANHPNTLEAGSELAWKMMHAESHSAMKAALAELGGATYTFVRIEPQGVKDRSAIRLYDDPTLVVRDASGSERVLQILGPVIEHRPSGGFKLLSYRG